MTCLLAIDQGTTSSRAIAFDGDLRVLARAQAEFPQHFPAPGHVEHDPEDLWQSTLSTLRAAHARAGSPPVAAIGITNQRETTLLWDRATGQALHPAIVWQDRRTAGLCEALRAAGHEPLIRARTGLLLDPYFSASKLAWLLDHLPSARARARAGELAFGTVDSWLIWRLTGGRVHATDATNAARTLLYDIHKGGWDPEICALFDIPMALLPEVRDSAADFGLTEPGILGTPVPIRGVAGDQQAATLGQACFRPGMMKATYGTGCFALLNTGAQPVASAHRLLTTLAYQLDGRPTYALEGSIFIAGAVVQWLRDGLGLVTDAAETAALAAAADADQQVVVVPAFTGFGAPYWRPDCRGAAFGLTRATGRAELVRAALESIGFQTRDLWQAMQADAAAALGGGDALGGASLGAALRPAAPEVGHLGADLSGAGPGESRAVLRVDGGMARNDWAMQFLADMLDAPVDRPHCTETTARGAAWLAGHQMGLVPGPAEMAQAWALERRFLPSMAAEARASAYGRWTRAVAATLAF